MQFSRSCRSIPNDLPKDAPVWADSSFHFSTSLIALAQREEAIATGRKKP